MRGGYSPSSLCQLGADSLLASPGRPSLAPGNLSSPVCLEGPEVSLIRPGAGAQCTGAPIPFDDSTGYG